MSLTAHFLSPEGQKLLQFFYDTSIPDVTLDKLIKLIKSATFNRGMIYHFLNLYIY